MAAPRTQTFFLEEARYLLFDNEVLHTEDIRQSDIEVDPDYSDVSTSFSYFIMRFSLLFISFFTALSITYAKSDMWDWDS